MAGRATLVNDSDYGILLVDADKDQCVVEEIELCGNMGAQVLTDRTLLDCQGY